MLLLLVLLFYPYLQVSKLYGIQRSWSEISTMLPRPQSYFIADASWFWAKPDAKLFSIVPMRHEHQMFPGMVGFSLMIMAIFNGARNSGVAGRIFTLMVFSLGFLVASTLYIGGFSLWYFIHWLPLASAIRAITRIDLIILLPLAYIAACFLDSLRMNKKWGDIFIALIVLPCLLIELSSSSMNMSSKLEWRQRLESKVNQVPKDAPKDAVLFFAAPNEDGSYKAEIDAMLAALKLGKKTMNGYSGAQPQEPSYGVAYGNDCAVVHKRVEEYLDFSKRTSGVDINADNLSAKILPIGFLGCN